MLEILRVLNRWLQPPKERVTCRAGATSQHGWTKCGQAAVEIPCGGLFPCKDLPGRQGTAQIVRDIRREWRTWLLSKHKSGNGAAMGCGFDAGLGQQ